PAGVRCESVALMDVETFRALRTGAGARALERAVRGFDAGADALAVSTDVRRADADLTASVAAVALTQAQLRRRARTKFGAAADRMWFTPDGLEQATRAEVADHRASRFA